MSIADDLYMEGLDRFAEEDWLGAISIFRRAVAADPRCTDAWHGIARAAFEAREQDAGMLDVAIDAAHRILDVDPDDVAACSTLSQVYVWKGDQMNAEMWGGKARIAGWKQQLLDDARRKRGGAGEDPERQIR